MFGTFEELGSFPSSARVKKLANKTATDLPSAFSIEEANKKKLTGKIQLPLIRY